ncbi:Uncharacterised protein [Mycobacteroides abscessus subsp. abscessus]|nr:Uncharacterised protein [Mycobacteroides abscessus subsp. abscessus]
MTAPSCLASLNTFYTSGSRSMCWPSAVRTHIVNAQSGHIYRKISDRTLDIATSPEM